MGSEWTALTALVPSVSPDRSPRANVKLPRSTTDSFTRLFPQISTFTLQAAAEMSVGASSPSALENDQR